LTAAGNARSQGLSEAHATACCTAQIASFGACAQAHDIKSVVVMIAAAFVNTKDLNVIPRLLLSVSDSGLRASTPRARAPR
jgi:hypothetical protein